MAEISIQNWLLDETLANDLVLLRLAVASVDITNFEPSESANANLEFEWERLLLAGSIFARSDERRHRDAALTIATAALVLDTAAPIKDAGAVLFIKLANERAIDLAERRGLLKPDLLGRLGIALRTEAERGKVNSQILVQSEGQWISVNKFQNDFWKAASEPGNWISASAPTASGKTFLVLQWTLDQVKQGLVRDVIYLAPTRALVSEIEEGFKALIAPEDKIKISSLPMKGSSEAGIEDKRIYVFTQERIHIFLNLVGSNTIDLLVVDEAHKIGDENRGVILQDAIERLERVSEKLRVIFVSPSTQNPQVLLADAPADVGRISVDTDVPTVIQNVIFAEQVPRKPDRWRLKLVDGERATEIGFLSLSNRPTGIRKKLAFIAAAIGDNGGTLIYANGAAEAEAIALLISQIPSVEKTDDEELLALADLVRKGIHPKYQLAKVLERGVAFHYGNMPSLIRSEVERLFREGKIKYLACTSTLIEGVNLSCRTIVLRGPRKGKGNPMEPHDFWNLAGRAGRWGSEFQGNIICIDPSDQQAWPHGIPQRARFEIERETDSVMDRADELTDYLSDMASQSFNNRKPKFEFETVSSYLLTNYLMFGSIKNAAFAKRRKAIEIESLDALLGEIAEQIDIPSDMAARHPGVSARGLSDLLKYFRDFEGEVENLLPAPVESFDSVDRFKTIMSRINLLVFPAFQPDGLVPLHALVVKEWLKGHSLANIIRRRIQYQDQHNRSYKLPNLIRETMDLVEQTARFRAPKYLTAYMDVLKLHLSNIGRSDLIEDQLDLGIALEYGVSSKTLVSLLELGLSRMSAVMLFEQIADDDLTQEGCRLWIAQHEDAFEGMGIPKIVEFEIQRKLSIHSS
jgi:hypothetical protein